MDINKALAELRAAFPRVTWLRVSSWGIEGRANGRLVATVKKSEKAWVCADHASGEVVDTDPVSAVRAWLAAQPTAAFYSEAPGGKTVEARGFVSVNTRRETVVCDSEAGARAYLDDVVAVYPIVIRVPVPVDPPVLVGEVFDV